MNKFIKFYFSVKEELDKVIFPTKGQIMSAFISVLIVVSIVTLFLSLIDLIINFIVSAIL